MTEKTFVSGYEGYEDIIDLPHYEPKHHVRMPIEKRAAQFAAFKALTGLEDAIEETADNNTEEEYYVPEEGVDY